MSDNIEEIIELYTKVITQVEKELEKRGISLIPKPAFNNTEFLNEDGEPVVPEDVTILTLTDLGKLSAMCNSYLNYLGPQVAQAELEAFIWEDIKDYVWAQIRSEIEGKKADKDEYVLRDIRYIRVNAMWRSKKTAYEILKMKYKQFETNLKLLSRELTRRGVEFERERIVNSYDYRLRKQEDTF